MIYSSKLQLLSISTYPLTGVETKTYSSGEARCHQISSVEPSAPSAENEITRGRMALMALYVQSCCYADGLKWVEYDAVWLKGDQDHQHQRRFRHNDNTLATKAKTLKNKRGEKEDVK